MDYKILKDENAIHPRDEENLGTLLTIHNSYVSGDNTGSKIDVEYYMASNDHICLPVYAYVHSSVQLNTTGFSCPWDSGQIGCIYVSKHRIREDFRAKRITKSIYNKVINFLNEEITILNSYLNDEVFGFVITDSDKEIDSCWGYYGFDAATQAAQESINYLLNKVA